MKSLARIKAEEIYSQCSSLDNARMKCENLSYSSSFSEGNQFWKDVKAELDQVHKDVMEECTLMDND